MFGCSYVIQLVVATSYNSYQAKHGEAACLAVLASDVMTERQHQYMQSGHASLCKQCAINIVYRIYIYIYIYL